MSVNDHGHTVFIPHPPGHGQPALQSAPSHLRPQVAVTAGSGFRNENNLASSSFGHLGLGQCGRRNAHGINGRVAAGRFALNEGDTDFGEKVVAQAILLLNSLLLLFFFYSCGCTFCCCCCCTCCCFFLLLLHLLLLLLFFAAAAAIRYCCFCRRRYFHFCVLLQ